MASATTETSILDSFQKTKYLLSMPNSQTLPISQKTQNAPPKQTLRRRFSSLSLKIHPMSPPSTSWVYRRSKSVSALGSCAGSSLRKWWDWGWAWIKSKGPTFAGDLEMNDEETPMLASHRKESWRHVLYKVRFQIRRLVGSDHLPPTQRFRYDSFSYAQNFDDGNRCEGQG